MRVTPITWSLSLTDGQVDVSALVLVLVHEPSELFRVQANVNELSELGLSRTDRGLGNVGLLVTHSVCQQREPTH
jgi:hypothetical protein